MAKRAVGAVAWNGVDDAVGARIVKDRGTGRNPSRRAFLRGGATLPLSLVAAPALAQGLGAPDAAPFPIATLAPVPPTDRAVAAAQRAFERALSRPVSVRNYRDGVRLVDAAASGRGDISVHTALTYAATASLCGCAIPVLRPISRDGAAGMRAIIIVRRDGPARQLTDLAGRALLGATRGSVAGEVVRRGLPAVREAIVFDEERGALARFRDGEGVALAGFERIDRDGAAIGGTLARLEPERHAVLWRSFPVWHGPVCVAAGVDPALRRRIVGELVALRVGGQALAGLGLGGIRGFVAAEAEDYTPLVTLLRRDVADGATTGAVRR